jgi:hypothetical protein
MSKDIKIILVDEPKPECVRFVSDDFISKVEQVKREIAGMSKAKEVLKQINEHYTYEGRIYIDHQDIQCMLRDNRVDNFESIIHKHCGIEVSFDESLTVILYDDDSALIVNSNGGIHAVG